MPEDLDILEEVEKSLAVDNIFVFLMLFTYFAVPAEFQKRVLMIGILGALVLRAVMILEERDGTQRRITPNDDPAFQASAVSALRSKARRCRA